MKKKLVVLINDKAPTAGYLDFLRIDYDLQIVNNSDVLAGIANTNDVNLMLFTGGEDVDPAIYGEKIGKHTAINQERDNMESKMFRFMNSKVPKLGICRGAQFLTVMSGGRLIQHVDNHGIGGTHPITFDHLFNGRKMAMTSTHHQMMYPYNLDSDQYVLCAHSTNHLSPVYLNGYDRNIEIEDDFLEPEIVYYPRTNSLAIQGHPESGVMSTDDKKAILDYIAIVLKL